MGVYSAYVHQFSRCFEELEKADNFLFCATSLTHSAAQKQQKEWDLNFLMLGNALPLLSSLLSLPFPEEEEREREREKEEEIGCGVFVFSSLKGLLFSWVRKEVSELSEFPLIEHVMSVVKD